MYKFDKYGDRLLCKLGLKRATTDWMPRTLFGFGAGLLVGAVAALVLAPKPGVELRTEIVDTANRIYQKGREQISKGMNGIDEELNSVGA
jgi:gas vesicle protein